MSAKGFSGVDLAIGSINGFRRWRLTIDGVLTGVTHRDTWRSNGNVAECHKYADAKKLIGEKPEEESFYEYRARANEAQRLSHDYASCECGYYAYFDGKGESGYASDGPHVSGYVEASGEVLIGTEGFRAMEARIIALCVPLLEGMWRLDPFFIARLKANYPGVPVFESEMAMMAEFSAPAYEAQEIPATVPEGWS